MAASPQEQIKMPAPVDFSALILGFSSAALYYLGEAPLVGKAQSTKNLPLARQNIDIIQMLKDKTTGNLNPDETTLLDQVLSDLQLKYINATHDG